MKYQLEQRGIGAGADADNCVGDDDLDKARRFRRAWNLGTAGVRRITTGNSCIGCCPESVSRPARRSRRHLNNMFALMSCFCASFDTDTPGSHAAVAKRCLKSAG